MYTTRPIPHLFQYIRSIRSVGVSSGLSRGSREVCRLPVAAHLRALHSSALGPLAEDLTPAAGAEVAARAVPHVPVVVHRALVQAAPLGGGAFITALTRALHLGVALREETGRSGLGFIRQPLFYFPFFSILFCSFLFFSPTDVDNFSQGGSGRGKSCSSAPLQRRHADIFKSNAK